MYVLTLPASDSITVTAGSYCSKCSYNDCCGTPKPPYIQVLQKQQYNYNLPDISLRVTPHLQLKNLIVSQNR